MMDLSENEEGQHLIQHCVIIQRDEKGYGLTVTGDNPVYVQSVKEGGAAHRTGVQVGDKIVKVNGTDVREFNHIEVVNLIKSGSYVALTLLGKPPSHAQVDRQLERPPQLPQVPRDPVMDERTVTLQRVLDQERQYYGKTLEEYKRRPTENLQRELAESTTRIKAFEAELNAQRLPVSSNNGPFSAPPGKTVSPTWQQVNRFPARCNSLSAVGNTSPPQDHDPNALYDNYPPAVISPGISDSREVPSSPSQPPMRKIPQKGDQLMPLSGIGSGTYPGKKRHKKLSLPEGPTHVRQHSSPESFFCPTINGSSSDKSLPVRSNSKKKSFDDGSGLSWKPGYPATKAHKNPLTASLPKAWKPVGHDSKGILVDNVSSKSSSSSSNSPPPTPTFTESLEKKIPNDAGDIYVDGDEESSYNTTESSKSIDPQNDPIMSMEDEEFASDDEKIDDHGPFNDLEVLKNKPAHMAVFLHYLISNSDPSGLFFWMVTDTYREGTLKEMKKWAYEIYSTFLDERAPLKVDNMDKETVIEPVVSCLKSEEITKDLFQHARTFAEAEIKELLQDFRNKRALGLGSLFGDHNLEDDNMDKGKELLVVEQTLMPHLEEILAELEMNTGTDASQVNRNNAMVSALTTFLRQVGITMKQQGNNANILERYQSFTRKENKPLFKMKSNKKMKGHHFVSTQYTTPTYCNHCGNLLWGAGDQGYQCSTCEYNVHKGNCFEAIEECPGTKKKRERKPTAQAGRSPSFVTNIRKTSQTLGPSPYGGKNWNPENDDENESDPGHPEYNKKKSGSFDEDPITGGRDRGMTADELSREGFIGSSEEGMSKIKSTSELFLDKPYFPKVGRSESMKTPREMSNKIMNMRLRKSVAGPVDSVGVDSPTMDVLSEDGRRARSRSPSFLPAEEEPDPDMAVDAQPPPWQQVVDKKLLKALKGKEVKRQEFIHELIYTERTHVRNLKVLRKVFYKPMIKMNIMSYAQIHQLFPNLDALIQLHVSLMQSMMARQEGTREAITCIGDVMLDRFDGEPGEQAKEACAQFCNHQKFALEQLKQRQRKDPKLQQFIVNCENDPLCRRLRLQDIISNSYQRLTKYPMLLEGIQKNTPSSHEDGKNIERAIHCTKDLLAYVNQSVKECEDQQRLADFQKKIDRRPLENTNNKLMEEFKNLDLTQKKLVYDGPLTWRINRTKCVDLHVLLLEDLLILLQKQDDKLVLKCLSSTFQAGYQSEKTTHSPIIKLSSVLTRNVATDKRAFFLVSTSSSVGPQIYELVTATVTDRKNWYKYITDAVEAFKIKERGRRNAVSVGGVRQPVTELDLADLPSKRVKIQAKEEPAKEQKPIEEDVKAEEENTEKETDADDDFSDPADDEEEDCTENQEEDDDDEDEETESEAPATQEELAVPKIVEPAGRQELQPETESEPDSEPETETEITGMESKEQVQVQSESPVKLQMATAESSPPSDSETDVLSAEDSEAAGSSPLNRALADLTNEESVDERSPLERNRNSVTSESSSSSSNDTLKMRGSFVHVSADEQDESVGGHPSRSAAVLLELLRSKDNDLRKILEEKSRLVAELRGANMTMGSATSDSHVNGDSVEARDLILAAILQANRLTVAVSDVLNPNIDDMSRGVGHLGYGGIQGDFSPQQQLVSSTSVLNEQLTTLLGVITDRDMVRDRLRCDLQLANSQIQRLKQGRSSSRRTRELPGSQFAANDDSFPGGFHSDSPRPSSPTSTIDFDSDYARLSETSDYIASEDNMDSVGRSSSMSGFRNRNSLASSGYRSSTASSRHTSRSRDESTTHLRQGRSLTNNRAYWSDDGAEYESQSQI
ncbi:rho guanine nucleotide exchange factor 11-like isoform X2 [Stylophora pistillata]|uniref:rho guanine nucleotide exchange factor 11-like isoform X2 n=1 Tax=Stylophora pistillata TaxID=50429 RepID=UPI000C03EAFF|nr:rho guanine nucleotide exchange factor 11-like isoform X2 [Stylophora pistillata]